MTSELMSLTWVTTLTALMWMPYILNLIAVRGLVDAVGYPEDPKPLSPWAAKMKAAHSNAVENLVVFAALVLIANAADVSNAVTVLACQIYFWARLVHLLSYTFAIPWVRTLAFAAGFACQIAIVLQLIREYESPAGAGSYDGFVGARPSGRYLLRSAFPVFLLLVFERCPALQGQVERLLGFCKFLQNGPGFIAVL